MKYILFFTCALISPLLLGQVIKVNVPSDYDFDSNNATDMATEVFIGISERLYPQMQINFRPASRFREWREINRFPNTCLYNKVKTPYRQSLAHFSSRPMTAFPPNRLVLRDKAGVPSELYLKDLFGLGLKIAITKGRSYGHNIDKFVSENPTLFDIGEGAESAMRNRKMLMQGRVDGMIEYSEVMIEEFSDSIEDKNISFHRILDQDPSIFGYIACAKSSQGKHAILLFDDIMAKSEVQEMIINLHQDYFDTYENDMISHVLQSTFSVQP
jgi:uncharacterized protein (TIGR02285 family)